MDDPHRNSMIEMRLTPSAISLLKFIEQIELGNELSVFQKSPEVETFKRIVRTYRGRLSSLVKNKILQFSEKTPGVIFTQQDLSSLIISLWKKNLSRLNNLEIKLIRNLLESPELSPSKLVTTTDFSYSQIRRATKRLSDAGLLAFAGILNTSRLGLARIVLLLEQPSLIPLSPYIEKTLIISEPEANVLICMLCPHSKISDLMFFVRSLRATSYSASLWHLGIGVLKFSDFFYDHKSYSWVIDPILLRMFLRTPNESIEVSPFSPGVVAFPQLTKADLLLIDILREKYDASISEIKTKTNLSESTISKKRKLLTKENPLVLPRTRLFIPLLTDRIVVLCDPSSGRRLLSAWNKLPLTYVSILRNIETSQTKLLLLAALPSDTYNITHEALQNELSQSEDIHFYRITAGTDQQTTLATLFDSNLSRWRWSSSDYLEVRSFAAVRRESKTSFLPIDLAT